MYHHMDHQGSVAKVTDANQVTQIAYVVDAFGRRIVSPGGANPAIPNDLVFQSNWITANVGTKRYGISPSRVYDFETGRFLQRDGGTRVGNLYIARMVPNAVDPNGNVTIVVYSGGTYLGYYIPPSGGNGAATFVPSYGQPPPPGPSFIIPPDYNIVYVPGYGSGNSGPGGPGEPDEPGGISGSIGSGGSNIPPFETGFGFPKLTSKMGYVCDSGESTCYGNCTCTSGQTGNGAFADFAKTLAMHAAMVPLVEVCCELTCICTTYIKKPEDQPKLMTGCVEKAMQKIFGITTNCNCW